MDVTALLRTAEGPVRRVRRALLGSALAVAALGAGTGMPAVAAADHVPQDHVVHVAQPAVAGGVQHPLALKVLGRDQDAMPLLTGSDFSGYTPVQVRGLLGLTGRGEGQTIAVVTAYDAPNIAEDLAVFNRTFELPAPPSFRKVDQKGGKRYPIVNAGWALEAALDVQWAHAVAPAASIILVEASSSALTNLMAAVGWAAAQPGVSVISGSWGIGEFAKQKGHDLRCKLTTAVCVFASGDRGNPASYPATSPYALAVGGTTLGLDGDGAVLSETAWSGSGGGVSLYTPKPTWQQDVEAVRRAAPDVSYDADPETGFAVYSSTPYDGQSGWFVMGGTSAGAPQWAGVLAAANGLRTKAGRQVLSAVTASGATPLHTALYGSTWGTGTALADVTTGTNGTCGVLCAAGSGYDTVTGVGSPRLGLDSALASAP